MSILLNWLQPKASGEGDVSRMSHPALWLPGGWAWGRQTQSGTQVSPEVSLTLSAYFAALRAISEDVAKLPLGVYRRMKPRGKERLPEHPAWQMLRVRPNPEMSSMTFRETMTAWALGWGRGIAEIVRDGRDRPRELWPIHPSVVRPCRKAGRQIYEVFPSPADQRLKSGKRIELEARDVLHIRGLGGPLDGYSIAQLAAESIGVGLAAQLHAASFFGNGTQLSGVLQHPGKLSKQSYDNLANSWAEKHGGPRNSWKPAILEEGMQWKETSVPPRDAQFLESRQFETEDIARWFRIPPHKIGHLLRSTNNNIEHQGIEYVQDTLLPWLIRWEQELGAKLFPEEPEVFAEHNVTALLRGDQQSRGQYYRTMIFSGVYSPNDVREMENMNPIPEPGADRYYMQTAMAPLEAIANGGALSSSAPALQDPPDSRDSE